MLEKYRRRFEVAAFSSVLIRSLQDDDSISRRGWRHWIFTPLGVIYQVQNFHFYAGLDRHCVGK